MDHDVRPAAAQRAHCRAAVSMGQKCSQDAPWLIRTRDGAKIAAIDDDAKFGVG
jgi:hypothetical protein